MSKSIPFVIGVLLMAAAGEVLGRRTLRARAGYEQAVLGVLGAFALTVVVTYLAALAHVLRYATLGLAAAMVVVVAVGRAERLRQRDGLARTRLASGAAPFVVIAGALAWFAVPLLGRAMPEGWDPAFHTSVIEMIRTQGGLPSTWAPYEPDATFRYPAGLHAALAAVGQFSRAPSEVLFRDGFIALGLLMLVTIYALGHRFGGTARVGLLAAAVYGFTDGWGTLAGHATWGGISNLAGLVLMGGFMLAVAGPGGVGVAALLAAACAFAHHLSFVLLGFTVAVMVVLEFATERRLSEVGRRALVAMVIAGMTAGAIVLLNPSGRFELGQGFRFDAEAMIGLGDALARLKWPVALLGLAGLLLALRTHRDAASRLLPLWAVALIAFWVVFDHIYRGVVYFALHERFTAFTPSRGLTDAAVPLAICAAVLVDAVARRLAWSWAWVAATVAAIVVSGYPAEAARVAAAGRTRGAFDEARAMCAQVKERTPAGAVVFAATRGAVGIWLPYLCGREFNYFPDPSYGMDPYRRGKKAARTPAEFARFIGETTRRPTWLMTRQPWTGEPVAVAGGWRLYELAP